VKRFNDLILRIINEELIKYVYGKVKTDLYKQLWRLY
jgi:hypothetical protein